MTYARAAFLAFAIAGAAIAALAVEQGAIHFTAF